MTTYLTLEARDRLGEILDKVRHGETILLLEGDEAVAEIRPVERPGVQRSPAKESTSREERLRASLRHPHLESGEMAEIGFAAWAAGFPDDASDLIAPGAGQGVQWTADRGWVGRDE